MHANMWQSIFTTMGTVNERDNRAQDNPRGSSTHNIVRRKTKDGFTEEKKVKFNLTGQRDMNCAIGGLGNDGISGTCFQSGCTVCRRSRKNMESVSVI